MSKPLAAARLDSSSAEGRWLAELQRGIPLCARPFEALARELDCAESDLIDFVGRCREAGLVRRFGAVFDTRRLGYRSVLCAAAVPQGALDDAAAKITPFLGVTHCYLREAAGVPLPRTVDALRGSGTHAASHPNLWFTLSYPADVFDAMADEIRTRLAPFSVSFLPATRRYKVDVVFGAGTRAREERTEDDTVPLGARDRAAVAALQGDTEVRSDYFAALAERAGMKEWDLLSTLELWQRRGRLKRIGLLLAHRTAGYVANGMCCWRVEGDTTGAGRALAARDEVTHCYERPLSEGFPYNLFAMVHATSPEEAHAQHADLHRAVVAELGHEPDTVMLLSTKEYKKTSMTFFTSDGVGVRART